MINDEEYYASLLRTMKKKPDTVEEKAQYLADLFVKEPSLAMGLFFYGVAKKTDLVPKMLTKGMPLCSGFEMMWEMLTYPGVGERTKAILDERGLYHEVFEHQGKP